jgi:hypothetical protein
VVDDTVVVKEQVKTTSIVNQNPFVDDEEEGEEFYQDLNTLKSELLVTKSAQPTIAKSFS